MFSPALVYSSLWEELRDSGTVEKPQSLMGMMYDSWYVRIKHLAFKRKSFALSSLKKRRTQG